MNKLLIFTAPSGAGKTTIVRHLLTRFEELAFSVSATTRARRPNEIEGKDYYFLSLAQFKTLVRDGAFLEWEEVYENKFYGTLRSEVERLWNLGKCVVFDIDVKGAESIKNIYPDQALAIFVKPPSFEVLVKRLEMRRTENEDSFASRVHRAKEELLFQDNFDAVLLNDDLQRTLQEAEKMVSRFIQI
ncbi:MAG: guanylate kinase [Saprospiraceae bacterium]|nr:guanylate kinase [Saprospiraceae bacterium]